MYYQYFGLAEAPFSIAVNPRYLFMSPRHRDALAHLLYGVGAGGGFILLTGEVGTGKTTINRCLLEQLPPDTDVAIILNPALNAIELLASACDELEIKHDREQHTLKALTDKLHAFLLENHARGRKTVLLIDEAQHLDFDVLEQIRLLTNLETNSEKLLQIILIGQPELAHNLAQPELRQLNQRITARYNLEPLNFEETEAYIQHRLQVAGMSPERVIFPASVVRGIYAATRGVPRLINVLCDRMLLGAYGRNKSRVDHAMLRQAVREVLGDQGPATTLWRWVAAAVVVLLLVWAGGWLLGKYTVATDEDVAATQSIPAQPTPTPTPELEPTAVLSAVQAPDVQQVPLSSSTELEAAQLDELAPGITPVVETQAEPINVASAMQAPGESMATLWTLNSAQPVPEIPCSKDVREDLACLEGEVWTWNELAAFDRPMVLEMISPERFSAEILLLGVTDTTAWLFKDAKVSEVSLAELAPYWTGRFRFLWHTPAGFEKPLALGHDNDSVAIVAQMFARLDAQPQPLAGRRFNQLLHKRVRLFQQQNGLADDGVVGVQTLLKLNQQLGIDVTAAQARQQLQAAAEEPTQP